jgi:hypothetical protein
MSGWQGRDVLDWIDVHSTPWGYSEYSITDVEGENGSMEKEIAYSAIGAQYATYGGVARWRIVDPSEVAL